jgi:hypothetical protein
MGADNTTFYGFTRADDGSVGQTWVQVERTGTAIDSVNIPNGTLRQGGQDVCLENGTNCPAAAALKTAYARLTLAAGCTVDRNVGITTCTWSSTGVATFGMAAAGFAGHPICTASPQPTSGVTNRVVTINTSSATAGAVTIVNGQFSTALDGEILVICVGT